MKKAMIFLLFLLPFSLTACTGTDDKTAASTSNAAGQVNKLTAESFQKLIWNYKTNPNEWTYLGDQPSIIDFYADWCRPCKMVAPIMDELAKEYDGKVRIYKINTDEQRELAKLFNINSIPAVLFIPKGGKPQMSVGAMQKQSYVDMIRTVLNVK